MRPLSVILILGLAMIGCVDTSQPVGPSHGQSIASANAPVSLAKKGPVVNWVSGNAGGVAEEKTVNWAGSGRLYADGSSDGEYEFNVHFLDGARWPGKVLSLKVYDGNTAVIGGQEISQVGAILPSYDIFIWVDGGEGANAQPDQFSFAIYWTQDQALAEKAWNMKPSDLVKEIAHWGLPESMIMQPVDHGNITVK